MMQILLQRLIAGMDEGEGLLSFFSFKPVKAWHFHFQHITI